MSELSQQDREQMARLSAGAKTVSDKIRVLAGAGFERADIARFLDKRYQHVRNVLVEDERKAAKARGRTEPGGVPGAADTAWVKLSEGGRIVLPAAMRKELGIAEGDDVQLRLEDDCIVVRTKKAVARELQDFFARGRDPDRSVVDEFLAERRAMWGEE